MDLKGLPTHLRTNTIIMYKFECVKCKIPKNNQIVKSV